MPAPAPGLVKGRVLTVDDCPAMRELMRASLERLGYQVYAADSGCAALLAVEEISFDAIVLDVEMPGMDGMATGHALRRAPRSAATLIAMHSSVDEAAVRRGFCQYDTFVPKSGCPWALGERVDGLLRSRRN